MVSETASQVRVFATKPDSLSWLSGILHDRQERKLSILKVVLYSPPPSLGGGSKTVTDFLKE